MALCWAQHAMLLQDQTEPILRWVEYDENWKDEKNSNNAHSNLCEVSSGITNQMRDHNLGPENRQQYKIHYC